MKFSLMVLLSHPLSPKKRAAFLQPDLRRNATRCTYIIANRAGNFKGFLQNFCPVQGRFFVFSYNKNEMGIPLGNVHLIVYPGLFECGPFAVN